jgi:hypothetical protein
VSWVVRLVCSVAALIAAVLLGRGMFDLAGKAKLLLTRPGL